MDQRDDDELDLLLSGGRMRGPVADRARERLLAGAVPRRVPFWRRLNVIIPGLAVAAATVILFAGRGDEGAGWRPKGGELGVVTVPELTCSGGTAAACPRGARLSIALPGETANGNVGAYAEPEGGGERIWYFSVEDGPATLVESGAARLASRSIVLGPEHAAGRYRVFMVVSDRPLSRAEILDQRTPGIRQRAWRPLTVVER